MIIKFPSTPPNPTPPSGGGAALTRFELIKSIAKIDKNEQKAA